MAHDARRTAGRAGAEIGSDKHGEPFTRSTRTFATRSARASAAAASRSRSSAASRSASARRPRRSPWSMRRSSAPSRKSGRRKSWSRSRSATQPAAIWFTTTWHDYEVLRDGIPALRGLLDCAPHHVRRGARRRPGAAHGQRPRRLGQLFRRPRREARARPLLPAGGRRDAVEAAGAGDQSSVLAAADLGDRAVLQRTVNVNGADLPIIGVAPERLQRRVHAAARSSSGSPSRCRTWCSAMAPGGPSTRAAQSRFSRPSSGGSDRKPRSSRLAPKAPCWPRRCMQASDRGEKQLYVRVEPLRIADPRTVLAAAVR